MGHTKADFQKTYESLAKSCYHRAKDDEPVFTLIGRDPAAAITILFWAFIRRRMLTGLTGEIQQTEYDQLHDARLCAIECQNYAAELGKQQSLDSAFIAAMNERIMHEFSGWLQRNQLATSIRMLPVTIEEHALTHKKVIDAQPGECSCNPPRPIGAAYKHEQSCEFHGK